ncbi:RibD family protein [Dolichospermum compactum]|uniref:Bifunctional deaminase-reductase-like protein n=1 Tax=Dolichospermum compactum NIES-806 TaxID=1973481 RepID=A0A1Z4V3Z0_9CYAN|nr:RibD family protein [Dolichospermum compactum]BAZ86198.1 bifunctional deaminase-reductase-like protein [Dolichospermum compactum NIES-806]
MMQHRPHTTVVLAMSADGKIADFRRSPARFGSVADKIHMGKQIAASDAVLFGAGTLRAYGTTMTITDTILLQQRKIANQHPQPVHIVISRSGNLNPDIKFFQQPVRRWLLTTSLGAYFWQERSEFEEVLVFETPSQEIDILAALKYLTRLQISRLAILGGGQLVASFLESNLIDEIWLTICPLILGGSIAPSPVEGTGFLADLAPKLQLLEVSTIEQEVFLYYRIIQ